MSFINSMFYKQHDLYSTIYKQSCYLQYILPCK